MAVGTVRPDVSELGFHLFNRVIHPELFHVCRAGSVDGEQFEANIKIVDSGHIVEFVTGGRTITEVVGSRSCDLPQRNVQMSQHLANFRDIEHKFESGLRYYACAHVDTVEAEVFEELDRELALDARRADLAYRFSSPHRLQSGAVSVLQVDASVDSLLVHATHSFPENLTIVRTQSLFEL